MNFTATSADNCFFIREEGNSIEYDILYIGKHKHKNLCRRTQKAVLFKNLRKNRYLGVQIIKTNKGFQLTQKEKVLELLHKKKKELLHKCNMINAKPCETPMLPDFLKNMYNESDSFDDNTFYRSTIGLLLYIAN